MAAMHARPVLAQWLQWVEPCRPPAGIRTAGVAAQPGVQGGRGELPDGVVSGRSRFGQSVMPCLESGPSHMVGGDHSLRMFRTSLVVASGMTIGVSARRVAGC